MAQITFKTGTLTFKGGTFSFKRPYFWSFVAAYSSEQVNNLSYDIFLAGNGGDGDIGTMADLLEIDEPAGNVPGDVFLFRDTSGTGDYNYYLFVSSQY